MQFTQYRSFHAVARAGSFTAAARRLNLSQPTITAQVRSLEAAHNIELFHRVGRRVELTEVGKALYAVTQRLFSVADEADELLDAAGALESGHLRVTAVGPYFVMRILSAFRHAYPGVTAAVTIMNSTQARNALLEFESDIAILAQPEADPRLYGILIGTHPLVVVVASTHPWATRKSVRIAEFHDRPMVMREVGSNTRRIFEAATAKAGVTPRIIIEVNSRDAIREAIAEGIGVGIVGEQAFVPDARLKALRLADVDLRMPRYIACLHERKDVRLIKAFFDIARGMPIGKMRGA